VAIFGEAVPESFATFDISLFTLFLVTAGEPWPEAMPRLNEDGTANWVVSLFCTAYTIVTFWLVLQVSFTVLLDNYIDASSTMAMQERLVLAEKQNREQQMKNPLEPLLLKLARDFSDDQDLSDRLHKLYQVRTLDCLPSVPARPPARGRLTRLPRTQVLDSDKSGGLESAEFCAAMKKLVPCPPLFPLPAPMPPRHVCERTCCPARACWLRVALTGRRAHGRTLHRGST
jgi:hypothetical protein